MSNFEDFCKKNELTKNLDMVEAAWNEQQLKIDEAILFIENCFDYCEIMYIRDDLAKILKGNNND